MSLGEMGLEKSKSRYCLHSWHYKLLEHKTMKRREANYGPQSFTIINVKLEICRTPCY
jgi:hypothetical protein